MKCSIVANHVHLLVALPVGQALPRIMQQLKGASARACNLVLGRTGAFWQHESYDRVMRMGETERVIRYILMNPVTAGLVSEWRDWPYTYLNPDIQL